MRKPYLIIPAIGFLTLGYGVFSAFGGVQDPVTADQSAQQTTADCYDSGYTKITYDNPNTEMPSDGFYSDAGAPGLFLVGIRTATGTPGVLYVESKDLQPYLDKGARYVKPVFTEMGVCERSDGTKAKFDLKQAHPARAVTAL